MAGIFIDPKYTTASTKAYNFIVSQMPSSPTNRLPKSYLVPSADPAYTYLKDRSFIYDVGLALLVLTTNKEYTSCKSIMNRLQILQNSGNYSFAGSTFDFDGSFDFSYYFDGSGPISSRPNDLYIYTGAIGWLVWGMCYYALKSEDSSYNTMINKAGAWLLRRQVTSSADIRYGLLKGGFRYLSGTLQEHTWCSTEHQCSVLQALYGLNALTYNSSYLNAANIIIERLKPLTTPNPSRPSLFDDANNRYFEGIDIAGLDNVWALDCTTWAGAAAKNLLPSSGITPSRDNIASYCRATANTKFLVTGKTLSDPNGIYSFSGTLDGFKPYDNGSGTGTPSIVWSEGTLGYVYLCMLLGLNTDALNYMDETIKLQNCKSGQNGVLYSNAVVPDFNVWESVCSSAWLYLLINNPDVLFKKIPDPIAYLRVVNGSSYQVQGNVQIPNSGFNRSFSMGHNSTDPSSGWRPAITLTPGLYTNAQALIAPPYGQDPLPTTWYHNVYLHWGITTSPPQIASWTSAWDGSAQNKTISLNITNGSTYYIIIDLS